MYQQDNVTDHMLNMTLRPYYSKDLEDSIRKNFKYFYDKRGKRISYAAYNNLRDDAGYCFVQASVFKHFLIRTEWMGINFKPTNRLHLFQTSFIDIVSMLGEDVYHSCNKDDAIEFHDKLVSHYFDNETIH